MSKVSSKANVTTIYFNREYLIYTSVIVSQGGFSFVWESKFNFVTVSVTIRFNVYISLALTDN